VSDAAKALLSLKDSVRVLQVGDLGLPVTQLLEYRASPAALLVQTRDTGAIRAQELRAVTKRVPTLAELDDLIFAWRVAKYVKSNAIVCVKDKATVGIGAGQMTGWTAARSPLKRPRTRVSTCTPRALRPMPSFRSAMGSTQSPNSESNR